MSSRPIFMSPKKLKIALVAPPWEAVPPEKYGGTEVVIYNLAEGLMHRGHDVTLFATGDSRVSARLEYIHKKAGYRAGIAWDNELFSILHTAYAFSKIKKGGFDIVHNHHSFTGFTFAQMIDTPSVSTCHSDLTHLKQHRAFSFYKLFGSFSPYVSISFDQRKHSPIKLNWIANVYNGIDISKYEYSDKPDDYFAWLGRFSREKGAYEAINVALKSNIKLVMAGKVDQYNKSDIAYFENKVRPLIDGKRICYIGEIDHEAKVKLLQNAKALIFPLQWHEPFGLVMTEALACGTPVIAHNLGSVCEIVTHGKTGFVTKTLDDMIAAVKQVGQINRSTCRKHVEQKFSAEIMVEEYERVYYKIWTSHYETARRCDKNEQSAQFQSLKKPQMYASVH